MQNGEWPHAGYSRGRINPARDADHYYVRVGPYSRNNVPSESCGLVESDLSHVNSCHKRMKEPGLPRTPSTSMRGMVGNEGRFRKTGMKSTTGVVHMRFKAPVSDLTGILVADLDCPRYRDDLSCG